MKEISKMRLGVLRELNNLRKFIDGIEKGVKNRDSEAIQKGYVFLKTLVYHMNEGDLTPLSIDLHHALLLPNKRKEDES